MDPLAEKYAQLINENVLSSGIVTGAVTPGKTFEGPTSEVKPSDPTENVEGLEDPKEDKDNSVESEPTKVSTKVEATNPFDALYNKILKEDNFSWSANPNDMDSLDSQMDSTPIEMNSDLEVETEEDEESEDEGDLASVLDHLKSAVSALEKMLDEADSDESEEMDSEEEMGSEEEEVKEAVDAEVKGHALVDSEKLSAGMCKTDNKVSAFKVEKKKADAAAGGKARTGTLEKQPESAGHSLTGKDNKVDAVKVGDLFNNK